MRVIDQNLEFKNFSLRSFLSQVSLTVLIVGNGRTRTLIYHPWECKMVQPLQKIV